MYYFLFILLLIVAYIFTFVNGLNDGCSVVATIIASNSISPKKALAIAGITEFIAPLFFGTAVASTIGKGIVKTEYIQSKGMTVAFMFMLCALVGATLWNVITRHFGIPSSSSHSLVGGMIGSGICIFGLYSIDWFSFIFKIVLMLFLTPVLGFIAGMVLMLCMRYLLRYCSPGVNNVLKSMQTFNLVFLAANHSSNDAQKSMGIVTLILMIAGVQTQFYIPFWVKVLSSLALSLGLTLGGWKIVKTVGRGIFRVKPVHSFTSQLSAASIIFISGLLGSPVSTGQIISSSIVGVGASERITSVRWQVVKSIVLSWVTTIPSAAVIAIAVYYTVNLFKFVNIL